MACAPAATAVRLLAGLLTFAVLFTATPLPLLQAAVAAPVEEEVDAGVATASSACSRRATGPGGPPGGSARSPRIVTNPVPRLLNRTPQRSPSGPFAPHPRC